MLLLGLFYVTEELIARGGVESHESRVSKWATSLYTQLGGTATEVKVTFGPFLLKLIAKS